MSQVEINYGYEGDQAFEENFYLMYLNGFLVDITIFGATHYVRLHKVILAANSKYFDKLIHSKCPSEPVIIIEDMDVDVLRALIKFMYIGKTKIHESKLEEMKTAADRLQIVTFKSATMRYQNINDQEGHDEFPVPFNIEDICKPINSSITEMIDSYIVKNKINRCGPAGVYFIDSPQVNQSVMKHISKATPSTSKEFPKANIKQEFTVTDVFDSDDDNCEGERYVKVKDEFRKY